MLMMYIVPMVCLLETENYMRLSQTFCSVSYVQPYVFRFFEEDLHDLVGFRGWKFCFLSGFRQFLGSFRTFQVNLRFNCENVNENALFLFRKTQEICEMDIYRDFSMKILLMLKHFIVNHISILLTQWWNLLQAVQPFYLFFGGTIYVESMTFWCIIVFGFFYVAGFIPRESWC